MRPGQTPWGRVGWLGSRADCGKASVWSFAALQFWAHSNCCQLGTDSRSLCSSWTDTAADFWAKKARFSGHGRTTRLLQACFDQKTILTGFSHVFCVGFIGLGSISSLQVAWLSPQTWTWWKPSSAATLELAWLPKCERERLGISKLRD